MKTEMIALDRYESPVDDEIMTTSSTQSPTKSPMPSRPIPCVGVICLRGDEVLLIKRGTPPRKGEWSIPGGRIEVGESAEDGALRELYEETGVQARLGEKMTIIKAVFEGQLYHLHDFIADWIHGEPRAGDDAAEAGFYPVNDLARFNMWPKTHDIILEAARLKRPV